MSSKCSNMKRCHCRISIINSSIVNLIFLNVLKKQQHEEQYTGISLNLPEFHWFLESPYVCRFFKYPFLTATEEDQYFKTNVLWFQNQFELFRINFTIFKNLQWGSLLILVVNIYKLQYQVSTVLGVRYFTFPWYSLIFSETSVFRASEIQIYQFLWIDFLSTNCWGFFQIWRYFTCPFWFN